MSSLIVQVCEVSNVEKHPDADNLDLLTIKGWNVVEKKGRFKTGDTVIYFPPDSVLPVELSDKIGCTQYLSRQRVKAAKLRGIVSCGVVWENKENMPLEMDVAEKFGVTKWEPPPPPNMSTGGQNRREPGFFHHYTDIENWNNYPDVLQDGEEVKVVEKVHGSNLRLGLIENEFLVGSHYNAKLFDEKIVFWKAALKYNIEEKMRSVLPKESMWVIFGEVFGAVQDLKYGLGAGIDLVIFDISCNGQYLDYDEFEELAKELDLPVVPFLYRGAYNAKHLAELAVGKAFQGEHIREGCVVRPAKERWDRKVGRVILKKINPAYLIRKSGTEFH